MSAVAASYATFTGWLSSRFQMGNVSNFAKPALTPLFLSWYTIDMANDIFPLPGPGAVTMTMGLSVGTYSGLPYPSSLKTRSMSVR